MAKAGSSKQSIESFGNNRYLVYARSESNSMVNSELVEMLSKYLGTPSNRITLIKDTVKEKVFEIL